MGMKTRMDPFIRVWLRVRGEGWMAYGGIHSNTHHIRLASIQLDSIRSFRSRSFTSLSSNSCKWKTPGNSIGRRHQSVQLLQYDNSTSLLTTEGRLAASYAVQAGRRWWKRCSTWLLSVLFFCLLCSLLSLPSYVIHAPPSLNQILMSLSMSLAWHNSSIHWITPSCCLCPINLIRSIFRPHAVKWIFSPLSLFYKSAQDGAFHYIRNRMDAEPPKRWRLAVWVCTSVARLRPMSWPN